MEIIDKKNEEKKIIDRKKGSHIFLGGTLILGGILWLFYNYGVLSECFFDFIFSWEMLAIIVGLFLLSVKNWIAGGVTAGVGVVFMITNLLNIYVSFNKLILPLLLVIAGVTVLVELVRKK